MDKLRLPTTIQTFRKVREGGYYYVDKTGYVDLLRRDGSEHFFLSRPRRFGKSLFVDTLQEAFEGNEELFEGLALHDKWDWTVRYPVVRFDFSSGNFLKPTGLEEMINQQLAAAERRVGITPDTSEPAARFYSFIDRLHESTGRGIVLLVDEYDKPILDALENPEIAHANRVMLRSVYGALKSLAKFFKFSFFTGVTKFTQVTLFSGMNILEDITLRPEYSAICGYTENDLDTVFRPELDGFDRNEIRKWYNGYNWLGEDNVYNPHDVLYLFKNRTFEEWWYGSGSPNFLLPVLRKKKVYPVNIGTVTWTLNDLSAFDIDKITPEAILFQSGYLTIAYTSQVGTAIRHRLDYPNFEVRKSLNRLLYSTLLPEEALGNANEQGEKIRELLNNGNERELEEYFRSLFAGIPHHWYDNSPIEHYEAHCASVFFALFVGSDLDVRAEDPTNRGRIDLAVILQERVYVIEFKIVEKSSEGAAMEQMQSKGYAEKYHNFGLPIHLVAVEYSSAKRNIVNFQMKQA